MEQEKVETVVGTETGTNTETVVEQKVKQQTDVKPEGDVKPETKPEGDVKKDIMIPKERFDEVNNKYKELASQMDEMKNAKEQMEKLLEDMKKAQEGTQSSIAETTAKLEAQVKSYETLMNEMVETKLQAVPEDMKDLIPEGLSTEQKLQWINKAEAKGLFKPKEKVVIGQPLNHSSEQDKVERMKKMNPLQLLASYYGDSK